MAKYRKKPVVIDAWQWHGHDLETEGEIVRYYNRPDDPGSRLCEHCQYAMGSHGWIDTLEGGHVACPEDWIITGVKGEMYPCKPDIFAATYDPA